MKKPCTDVGKSALVPPSVTVTLTVSPGNIVPRLHDDASQDPCVVAIERISSEVVGSLTTTRTSVASRFPSFVTVTEYGLLP